MNKHLHPISVVLLAHQYSLLFERVVEAVRWADEIVILTSHPSKEIEALCERVSAKCFFRQFDGFGPQKQFAFSKASHDWILNLDSDELVTPEFQKEVEELLSSDAINKYAAYSINQKLVFLEKELSFSGTKARPIRLFDRRRAQMTSALVHERVETKDPVSTFRAPVLHYSYFSLDDYLTKFNRYTSLGAKELHRKGKKTNPLFAFGRFPFLFLRRYIFQLGILDGYYGFLWCFLSASYSTVKYLKLFELNRKNPKGIPVLMYHAIQSAKKDILTVNTSDFLRQIRWLYFFGYETISLDLFLNFQENETERESLPEKPVLLTFDDGYRGLVEEALPILSKKQFKGCLFVTTAYILERENNPESPYLSVAELKQWCDAGMEVALHSHSHPNYRDLTPSEVTEDLRKAEDLLNTWGIPYLKVLAYPFGARPKHPEELQKNLLDHGIRAAFRIGNRVSPWVPIPNRFEIKRIDIQGTDSFSDFRKKVRTGRVRLF
ncbi:MAG: glycosyltransferase [Proteobacteria bacterium]|nr:glycosyltransferase [Pseudomonadota bacterium]